MAELDNHSLLENQISIERIGAEKSRSFLEEVSRDVRPQEHGLDPIVERALDMGFVANADGSVDFPDPLLIDGRRIDYIIDPKLADVTEVDFQEDCAPAESSLPFGEQVDPSGLDRTGEDVGVASSETMNPANSAWYVWTTWTGTVLRRFHMRAPWTSTSSAVVGVRLIGFNRTAEIGQTEYYASGAGWVWTQWRRGGSTGVFNNEVVARRARAEWA